MCNPYIKDFPILKQTVNGKPLAYLDNAATTQKPDCVIEASSRYYRLDNANPHRGAYALSVRATELYEAAREAVKNFIKAEAAEEVIFTRGATEALNLLAYSYGMNCLREGDEIVISIAEHHSNVVPWQQVAAAKGAKLIYMYLNENGNIPDSELEKKITSRTKIVSITQISNVLGTIYPVKKIIRKAHESGAVAIVDLAQSIAHMKTDIRDIDADFAVFSGHKMFAPMGIGVLYGKKDLLEAMPPFLFGGDMIEYVSEQTARFAHLPQKFEAGTQNVEGAAGLSAAIRYINSIGFDSIRKAESELTRHALERLSENPYISIVGPRFSECRAGVISFTMRDVHPHDVASILDADGIAIRAGHHCAHPLMKFLGITATSRVSLCFYNTKQEIDRLAESLESVRRWLHFES